MYKEKYKKKHTDVLTIAGKTGQIYCAGGASSATAAQTFQPGQGLKEREVHAQRLSAYTEEPQDEQPSMTRYIRISNQVYGCKCSLLPVHAVPNR